jgi:DNA mismatch repair protein MutS
MGRPPKAKSPTKDPSDTPVMRQYLAVKERFPDALLFFRMGDFYELFFEDAVVAAEALDLTLTSRNKNDPDPVPMCGVPHHASLGYVSKLIERGFKVAVCEQMEDPSKVKGLVKREVTRVITPGVVLEEENLAAKESNFLAAVALSGEGEALSAAVAVIDASTFEFTGTRAGGLGALAGELHRLEPREILVAASARAAFAGLDALLPRCCITAGDDGLFEPRAAHAALAALIGAGDAALLAADDPLLALAAGAAAGYVRLNRPGIEPPRARFVPFAIGDSMILDEAAKSHLELVRTVEGAKQGSLLDLIDRTRTGMGGRLLRRRINYPLTDVARIRRRLDRVELFFRDAVFRADALEALGRIADIERIAGRIGSRAASPRDLGALRGALHAVPDLDDLLTSCPAPGADDVLGGPLDRAGELREVLERALVDEPPVSQRDGGIFREGFDAGLDDLIGTVRHAKDFIAALEQRERERTGIGSLKVSFNRVFGYYIDVTRANLGRVPEDYRRKQTVATGERFVTPELEEWEAKVLSADDRRKVLEQELFTALAEELVPHVPRLLELARRVAGLDCAAALAETARRRDYVRPEVDAAGVIDITDGRHPIVEARGADAAFVPNSLRLDPDGERMLVITGPNMAGKSTVMRQTALIAILAQLGSFVPASKARLGVCDRLFTRVGAADNIARGASTFMVEMNETAAILRGATRNSLVILDEVGRGTSTFDGLSIAWAVGEYLHDTARCKVLFATHYHELVELANLKAHAANYHVAAREYGQDVVFLRKLVPGGTSHSFGIQVARMAGLPEVVVQRAREVLGSLEEERPAPAAMPEAARRGPGGVMQLDLFGGARQSEVERILKEIDLDRVTPIEALALLGRLKGMVEEAK